MGKKTRSRTAARKRAAPSLSAAEEENSQSSAKIPKTSSPAKKVQKKRTARTSKQVAKKNLKKDLEDEMTSSPGIKTYFPAKEERMRNSPVSNLVVKTKETEGKITFTLP